MDKLPAVVWMPNDMFETFAERSPRMAETPCLVLTLEVVQWLRSYALDLAKGGITVPEWLRDALEAGNG